MRSFSLRQPWGLALQNLLQDMLRLALSVLGIALALMLILFLLGLRSGIFRSAATKAASGDVHQSCLWWWTVQTTSRPGKTSWKSLPNRWESSPSTTAMKGPDS